MVAAHSAVVSEGDIEAVPALYETDAVFAN